MKNDYNIPAILKQMRKSSGLKAKDVVSRLAALGFVISDKTLYGYESGISMINADMFVALCKIYKCDNPLEVFRKVDTNDDIQTIAAHHDGEDWTRDELDEIERFKEYVKSKKGER